MDKSKLNPDEILKTEFEYAANSAFQANEDRSKVASFFLVSVGSLIAAVLGVDNLNLQPEAYLGLAGIFIVLTLFGVLTVMQLARLREAWTDSALAMNRIKDFYKQTIDDPDFSSAFHWRSDSIPKKFKPKSVSYYTVLEVALLSGLTFGAAVCYLLIGLAHGGEPVSCMWWLAGASGLASGLANLVIYQRMLR